MIACPNCGAEELEGKKFCRHCGTRLVGTDEEAATWRLPPTTSPSPGPAQPTTPVSPSQTAEPCQPTSPAYVPPAAFYQSSQPALYQPPPVAGHVNISLGEWLSGGWQVYKENWAVMTVGAMLGAFFGAVTLGILAGPTLMGLFRMAFKTMRGEQPEVGDIFKWEGRFLQAFLTFLIFAAIHIGLTGAGKGGLVALAGFIVDPLLTVSFGLSLPLILERKMDVAAAINEVGRLIFSRDALMWWVVGLVFATLSVGGLIGCFIGFFVTLPWMVSSAAVAYRDIFGLDDPNRTHP